MGKPDSPPVCRAPRHRRITRRPHRDEGARRTSSGHRRHPEPEGDRRVKVEMSAAAIDARLREASRLAGSLRPEDRLATKINLSASAVAARLKEASDLLDLC